MIFLTVLPSQGYLEFNIAKRKKPGKERTFPGFAIQLGLFLDEETTVTITYHAHEHWDGKKGVRS